MKYQSRSFAEQVDKVLSNTFDRANAVYVCDTPKILEDVGLDGNLPMLTTARHIKNANKPKNDKKHHHGLTKEQLKRIPEIIANPVMIMDSQNENSIIAVSDMFDEDKSPIIITIKVDGKGMFNNIEVNSNFVTSYYGKDGFSNFIKHSVDRNAFLYINKEKAIALSAESSTQWLEQLKDYDFNIIIRKTNANVNEDTTKFSMRDSDYIETVGDQDIQYQFAGRKSETANATMLQKAENMEQKGVDSETIRKETGWFRGYDSKWRFEIDDSKSVLIEDPKLEKHEDGDVYFTGKLSDILSHNDLYEAYPQLKDINIVIQTTELGVRGIYQPNSNYITLSLELFKRHTKEYEYILNNAADEIKQIEQTPEYKEYNKWYEDEELSEKLSPEKWLEEEKKAREKFYSSDIGKRYYYLKWGRKNVKTHEFGWDKAAKTVLMHEIQHAVQHIEEFASGSNVEYWKKKLEQGYTRGELDNEIAKLKKEYEELLAQAPEELREKINEYNELIKKGEVDKAAQIDEELANGEHALLYDKLFNQADLINMREEQNKLITAEHLYMLTAGEVESRDTSARLEYTEKERKKVRPDIDRLDVVFTEDAVEFQSRGVSNKNYSKYDDLTKLDTDEIKVYNDYGWTYQLFTAEDYMLLNEKFNEKYNLNKNQNDFTLGDGSKIVEVNNKLVLIGGSFENPIIYDVFVVNSNNETEAEVYKELLLNDTEGNRSTKQRYIDICKSYEYYSKEETVRNYESADFSYHKGQEDTGERAVLPESFKNYGYTKQFDNGERNNSEVEQGISDNQIDEVFQMRTDGTYSNRTLLANVYLRKNHPRSSQKS